ncbi:MAG: hypothetical protein LBQ79_00800 [Deltaproteobacteria bacterium]|jgi:pyrrolysine biosynthesis protein PylD|nr:hypothetical protein [Deltaproteobacteria bacterium]
MTRLTGQDIGWLYDLKAFDRSLAESLGTDVFGLSARAWSLEPDDARRRLRGLKLAAVTMTSGEGEIPGFSAAVAATGERLGLVSRVMALPDQAGLAEACEWGADVIMCSDDYDFVARDAAGGRTVHNDPATARAFVAALEIMNGGTLSGARVLVLGLGKVGTLAAERIASLGGVPLLRDSDPWRVRAALDRVPEGVILEDELAVANEFRAGATLIFEAVPSAIVVSPETLDAMLRAGVPRVAAPGVPLAWPREWLSPGAPGRLWHDPLASGTAAMLAGLVA